MNLTHITMSEERQMQTSTSMHHLTTCGTQRGSISPGDIAAILVCVSGLYEGHAVMKSPWHISQNTDGSLSDT
jgi:hypothetical protein